MSVRNDNLAEKVKAAREVDVKAYLQKRGFEFNKSGFCKSPFKRDSNWSFKVYTNTNSFFDFSTGIGGDTIQLVRLMENCGFNEAVDLLTKGHYSVYKPIYKNIPKESVPFQLERYINENDTESKSIREYAASRSIRRGFECGCFFTKESDGAKWKRNPAVAFVLRDKHLGICGVKFRKIPSCISKGGSNDSDQRFSSRGTAGFYVLENILTNTYEEPILFLVESESSANSLWEYCCETNRSAVIVSFGSVGSQFDELPIPYQNLKDKRLIIDYDGSEELYQQRLENFSHLTDVKPVKIILPKGEDLNSLYSSKQMYKVTNILFNG
jgi:hypothetical protein